MKKKTPAVPPTPLPASASPFFFVFLGWSVFVVGFFLYQNPLHWTYVSYMLNAWSQTTLWHPYGKEVAWGFFVALLLGFSFAWTGLALLRFFGDLGQSSLRGPLAVALGAGVWAALVQGIGGLGLWRGSVFWVLVAMALGVGGWLMRRTSALPPSVGVAPLPWRKLWMALLMLMAFLYIAGAACPEIFYDALHYHLAVPAQYALSHHLKAIPTMLYSNFVMTVQMLYGVAITLGNEFSAKALHGASALMIAVAMLAFSRRFFHSSSGLLAALLFLSMPMVMINATTAGTDVAGAFLFVASALAFFKCLERPGTSTLALAGLLAGVAASCKYPAFIVIPMALVVLVWQRWDEKRLPADIAREAFLFAAWALVGLSPVLIKNMALHGNPLYPFGALHWGHPRVLAADWAQFLADANQRDLKGELSSLENGWRFLCHPWFISFGSQGTVGPLLLMGLPWMFWPQKPQPLFRSLRRYAALLWLSWLLTSTVPRYGLPAMALASLLMAEALLNSRAGFWRHLLLGAFATGIVANLYLQALVFHTWEGWRVLGGQASKAAYLGAMHPTYPTPPYDGIAWMNENLPPNARVLFAGESRSYYLERQAILSSIPGPQPVVRWSQECRSPQEFAQRLRQEGVTHLFLNFAEAVRTEGYHAFAWDAESWSVFSGFWDRYVRLVWKKESNQRENPQALYVYEVMPESQAQGPHAPPPNPFSRWAPR